MIEPVLRTLLNYPGRRGIVLLLTAVTGVAALWPATDKYLNAWDENSRLNGEVEAAADLADRLPERERQVEALRAEQARWSGATVRADELHQFRNRLVELVRSSGCELRQIREGTPETRPWKQGSHPLELLLAARKPEPAPFELRAYPVMLAATGELAEIRELASQLRGLPQLKHVRNLSLRANGQAVGQVELEIELWVFDLVGTAAQGQRA